MKIKPILISVTFFSFFSFLRRAIFYAFFYVYLRNFLGLSTTNSALLGTLNLGGSMIGQLLLWGPRLNKNPSLARTYVIRGEIIAGFVYLIAYSGHRIFLDSNYPFYAALYLMMCTSFLEVFWSGSDLGIRHLITEATKGKNRGRLVGSIDGIGLLGQLIGFLVGGFLYSDGIGFSEGIIFYIVVLLMFSCAIVIFLSPKVRIFINNGMTSAVTTNGFRDVWKVPYYFNFVIILGILIIGLSSSNQVFLYYVTDSTGLGFNEQLLSYLLILFTISGGIISPIGGKVSDFIGRIPVILISGIGATFSLFLFFLLSKQSFIVIALIYILQGACLALIQSVSFSYSADLLPIDLQGSGFGIFNITLAVGWGLAGFIIGGPISDILITLGATNGSAYRVSFLVSSTIVLIGCLFLIKLHMKQKKSVDYK